MSIIQYMWKYIVILFVSCSNSIFKNNKLSSSSSSTSSIPIKCSNIANSNDVTSATAWNSFLEDDSYLLFTKEQVLSLSAETILIGKRIELCADIDLKPLYDAGTPHFMLPGLDKDSSFNGNNFTLSNFTFISTDPDLVSVALFRGGPANHPNFGNYPFSGLNRGEIKNLVVDNIVIKAESTFIAGISCIHQMNPIVNVSILSGTLENTKLISPDGGMIGGIIAFFDGTSVLSNDNILTKDFIFENNSTNITLKYTNDKLAGHDFYSGGLIGCLFPGNILETSSISIVLKNNFTNFTTFGNTSASGLIAYIGTDLCNPGVADKCMHIVVEDTYSKAFHNVISSEDNERINRYAGIIGIIAVNTPVKLILNNIFTELAFSLDNSSPKLTSLFDYTVHYSGTTNAPEISNNFGVTSTQTPAITTTYLTTTTQGESYFYDNSNLPISLWDTSMWEFTGSALPVLIH